MPQTNHMSSLIPCCFLVAQSADARTTLQLEQCLFQNNIAGLSMGGAVDARGLRMLLVVAQSDFQSNSAPQQGGALSLTHVQECFVDQCLFEQNNANKGGAVALQVSGYEL